MALNRRHAGGMKSAMENLNRYGEQFEQVSTGMTPDQFRQIKDGDLVRVSSGNVYRACVTPGLETTFYPWNCGGPARTFRPEQIELHTDDQSKS